MSKEKPEPELFFMEASAVFPNTKRKLMLDINVGRKS
jgi:hypothetical protein